MNRKVNTILCPTFGPGASVKRADVVQVINTLADVSSIAVLNALADVSSIAVNDDDDEERPLLPVRRGAEEVTEK